MRRQRLLCMCVVLDVMLHLVVLRLMDHKCLYDVHVRMSSSYLNQSSSQPIMTHQATRLHWQFLGEQLKIGRNPSICSVHMCHSFVERPPIRLLNSTDVLEHELLWDVPLDASLTNSHGTAVWSTATESCAEIPKRSTATDAVCAPVRQIERATRLQTRFLGR